jgi:hypothetical protein
MLRLCGVDILDGIMAQNIHEFGIQLTGERRFRPDTRPGSFAAQHRGRPLMHGLLPKARRGSNVLTAELGQACYVTSVGLRTSMDDWLTTNLPSPLCRASSLRGYDMGCLTWVQSRRRECPYYLITSFV